MRRLELRAYSLTGLCRAHCIDNKTQRHLLETTSCGSYGFKGARITESQVLIVISDPILTSLSLEGLLGYRLWSKDGAMMVSMASSTNP